MTDDDEESDNNAGEANDGGGWSRLGGWKQDDITAVVDEVQ